MSKKFSIQTTTYRDVVINELFCAFSEKDAKDILLNGLDGKSQRPLALSSNADSAVAFTQKQDSRVRRFLVFQVSTSNLVESAFNHDEKSDVYTYREVISLKEIKNVSFAEVAPLERPEKPAKVPKIKSTEPKGPPKKRGRKSEAEKLAAAQQA